MNDDELQQELQNLTEGVDTSHIQNDEQLLEELSTILGQVVEKCDALQKFLKSFEK